MMTIRPPYPHQIGKENEMAGMTENIRYLPLAMAGILTLGVLMPASSNDAKPTKTKGISLQEKSTLPLGRQIPELEGYALQIRTIVLEPGANSAYHSHAKRPVVAYLVSGDYTEHRDGEGEVVHKPGEQWVEGADVAHWSENRGSETTYLINVEVYKPKN
jgi:quercetin dioxygenase-like cupin family protein